MNKDIDVNQMNLYDYVMGTFERICDLTEARSRALHFYLNNCMAKYVNVAEFKAVFEVNSFDGILNTLTDMSKFDELNKYGLMCYGEASKEEDVVIDGPKLNKTPLQ